MKTRAYFPPEIVSLNPWWQDGFDYSSHQDFKIRPRHAFDDLLQVFHKTNLMVFIKGLRRLGKSTLLRQLALSLIKNKQFSGKKIFLIEFSETFNDLGAILFNLPHDAIILLDEIQNCVRWRDTLKRFYDAHPLTKIVFTGSAAISMAREKESLLGRILPINLLPLSFGEYLYLKYGWRQKDKNPFVNMGEWYEFVQFGEFPETLKIETPDLKYRYLQESILNPLLTRDISLYHIEKRDEFLAILKSLANNIGQISNKTNLSAEIGISRPLVNKYLGVLEDIGMVKTISNYHKSVRKQILSDKKIYFNSINLCLALLGISSYKNFLIKEFKGHIFENIIFNELKIKHPQLFYWRRNQKEIDFLAQENGIFIAYEVKNQTSVKKQEAIQISMLAKTIEAKKAVMIYGGLKNQANFYKTSLVSFLML